MKTNRWGFALLLFSIPVIFGVAAEPTETDQRPFEEIKAKAITGDAEAQFQLGRCYDRGEGVAKDQAEAVKWYRKAADQNHAKAQYNLAISYDRGEGVAKDQGEAVKWYRKAAEQNLAITQSNLGTCYEKGEGVTQDQVEAAQWYRKAAEQNSPAGQYNLSRCYVAGKGVTQDYSEGYKWLMLAAAQGEEESKKAMALLERMMTPEQIAEGRKRARDFKPRLKKNGA